jgi:hypothetical protein
MGSRSRPLGTLGVGGDAGLPPGGSGRGGRLGGLGGGGSATDAGPSTAAPEPTPKRLTPAERFKPTPQPRSTRRTPVEV